MLARSEGIDERGNTLACENNNLTEKLHFRGREVRTR
jgi:hypothetical protein